MSGARAVTSLELRRHLRNTLSQSPRGSQSANGNISSTSSATATSPIKIPKRITKVRRDLFGPIDREECNRFIEMEMSRKQTIDSERWGFDFTNGVPLYNNENFEWEPVYNFLPNYYSQSHHQRQPDFVSITAPNTANTSSSHYFQDPNDQSAVDIDVSLLNGGDNEGGCSGDSSDDNKMIIDSTAKQSSDFDLDTVLAIGSISERTPLQNHNSNQQPYRKFRQLSITDLMRNRKRFATTLNVSPVKKATASMTSTTATATITSSPSQSKSTCTSAALSLTNTKPLTIRSAASMTITSSSRRSIEAKRTAKKLKFSKEPQTKSSSG